MDFQVWVERQESPVLSLLRFLERKSEPAAQSKDRRTHLLAQIAISQRLNHAHVASKACVSHDIAHQKS